MTNEELLERLRGYVATLDAAIERAKRQKAGIGLSLVELTMARSDFLKAIGKLTVGSMTSV